MAWQRLSTRVGKKPPSGPYEGVPPHLVAPVLAEATGPGMADQTG